MDEGVCMDKEDIKWMIFNFMYDEFQPDENEQINFENYFERWWRNYNYKFVKEE